MANSRSARKRIRANERKHLRNRGVRSAVRTKVTKARRALLAAEVAEAPEQVLQAVRALDRAAEKGILHPNNANRRKSRLMAMAHKILHAAETAGADEQAAARSSAVGGEKGKSTRGGRSTGTGTSTRGGASRSAAAATKSPARTATGTSRAKKPS